MTHILEHTSIRYTWELVRHTYLVDIESEIEIRQVEISPSRQNRLLDPPYPFTPFFEIEIDQIQKNGNHVFSLRNISPVRINQKPGWNFIHSLTRTGSSRVIQRFQSQDGETETRWLYTDDFFLISLSSGDRHDLSMLLSLILGKLNMIALSVQSGRRIRSEFENQQNYRAAMSTMFSEGVDGAFRDVPVYQQHGEGTGSGPEEYASAQRAPADRIPSAPAAGEVCGNCGAALSITTKFCGSCGTAVTSAPSAENASAPRAPAENDQGSPGTPAGAGSEKKPSGSRPESQLVIDVKTVEDLQDTSWLYDEG
jgi:hypothetical protein